MRSINHSLLCIAILMLQFLINVMPLYAQYQLTPECYVDIKPDRYIIHFTLPKYRLDKDNDDGDFEGEKDDCGIFSVIEMDDDVDYDVTDIAGYPELPFFSLNLLLPDCDLDQVNVYMEYSTINKDYPPYFITPATLGSWVNEKGDIIAELDNDCFNKNYYSMGRDQSYPNGFYRNFYSVSDVYSCFGARGVTLSIFPFSYYPHLGYMDILYEAVIVVEFKCGDLIATMEKIQSQQNTQSLAKLLYFDTFNDLSYSYTHGYNGSYLIVASHRSMEENLISYIEYKQKQNYYTEAIYLDDYQAIGNPALIRQLIYSNNILPNPDFVLLVGNLTDIPSYSGIDDANHPFTDDPYHPFLGRWILSKYDEKYKYQNLRNIIDKTIQNERDYYDPNNLSIASLFSGIDKKKRVTKQFYRNIKQVCKSFDKTRIPYEPHDGTNFTQSQAMIDMIKSLMGHTRFFVYRGHGTNYIDNNNNIIASGISEPYNFNAYQINNIGNTSPTPMGFGFACSLNTYSTENSFGTQWVASTKGGGTIFYGATTSSYRSSNNYLAKWTFRTLKDLTKKVDNFPISLWLRLSEYKYYNALPTNMRSIEVQKYSLIGDPTFSVYGMDYSGTYAPFHSPQQKNNEDLNEYQDKEVLQIQIYDVLGKLLTTITDDINLLNTISLNNGIYIYKVLYTDGSTQTNKILK